MIDHELQLTNVNDGDVVNYRLILIKGRVVENNDACIHPNGSVKCSTQENTSYWPLFNGKFKCMALLKRGLNKIVLCYGGMSQEVHITFSPHKTEYYIVPIYLIPSGHNGCFQAPDGSDNSIQNAKMKISFGLYMIQSLFAEKLMEQNYDRKSFQVESDIDATAPICHEFYSKLPLEKVNTLDDEVLWEEIGRELMMSDLGSEKKKFVCFISSTFWDGKVVHGDPALGGGGLALLGSASLHSWPNSIDDLVPSLSNDMKLDPLVLDNSCYRGTYNGVLATSLGSAAHEIGHIFNLGHTRGGLMSRGFDNIHLVFIQTANENKSINEESEPCLSVTYGPSRKRTEIPIRVIEESDRYTTSDLTYIESGCAGILAHHKWFNPPSDTHTQINYDKLRHVIESEVGLRVVELRGAHGAVRRSWVLRGTGRHLVIPTGHSGATLIAVDSNGTIFTDTV